MLALSAQFLGSNDYLAQCIIGTYVHSGNRVRPVYIERKPGIGRCQVLLPWGQARTEIYGYVRLQPH